MNNTFTSEDIEHRVHVAIIPQLRALKKLEDRQHAQARTEQLRQRYNMHDATEIALQFRAAQDQFNSAKRAITNMTKQFTKAVTPLWDAIRDATRQTREAYVNSDSTPEPVPATQHVALHPDEAAQL